MNSFDCFFKIEYGTKECVIFALNEDKAIECYEKNISICNDFEINVKAEIIEFKNNFPNDGEAYAVGKAENGKYFFAWGWEYPFAEEVPDYNIPDGENGINWHNTEKEALADMEDAIDAWDTSL